MRLAAFARCVFLAVACCVYVVEPIRVTAASLPTASLRAPAALLSLEVARSDADREHGLMNRRALPAHHGMIFVFNGDSKRNFWMKNTLVPLDMVFLNARGNVTSVAERVPATKPNQPDHDVPQRHGFGRYVIELPAGEARTDGLNTGTTLHMPSLP